MARRGSGRIRLSHGCVRRCATLEPVRDENGKRVTLVRVAVQLPAGFPEKYKPPMERAIDHCAVKKHIMEPPLFELTFAASVPPRKKELRVGGHCVPDRRSTMCSRLTGVTPAVSEGSV